jgi:photosystem II stability/assembly factor-like uncharacterized protein
MIRLALCASLALFAGCFLDDRFKGTDVGHDLSISGDMGMVSDGDIPSWDLAMSDMPSTPPCDPQGVTGPACQWRWQTPAPQGDDVVGTYAFADDDVFAINSAGLVIHRDGNGWTPMAAHPGLWFTANGLIGCGTLDLYAFGKVMVNGFQSTVVFHSLDKGLTWANEYQGTPATTNTPAILAGACLSGYTLFVGEKQFVLARGTTGFYSVQKSPSSSTDSLTGVAMTSTVDVVASAHGSYWSPHLSYTWTGGTLPTGPTYYFKGICLGGTQFWTVGNQTLSSPGATILTSADGKTWTAQTPPNGLPTTASLTGCIAADSTHAFVVGATAFNPGTAVVGYTQNGTSWLQPNSVAPSGLPLLAISRATSGSAITVVGQQGSLWRSTDGANTFISEKKGDAPTLTAMASPGPSVVFAVGAAGAVYRTLDDGATWTKLVTNVSNTLSGVFAASAKDVFVVGDTGLILHSTDGTTFAPYTNAAAPIPSNSNFTDVSGNSSVIYAVASTTALRSSDDGASWHVVTIPNISGPQSAYVQGSDVFIGDSSGAIFHSSDGTTWTSQAPTATSNVPILQIRGRASGQFFAVANDSQGTQAFLSLASPTGTWTATNATGAPSGTWLTVTPTQILFSGPLGRSTDDGATFTPVSTGISYWQGDGAVLALADNDIFMFQLGGFDTGPGIIHYGD